MSNEKPTYEELALDHIRSGEKDKKCNLRH